MLEARNSFRSGRQSLAKLQGAVQDPTHRWGSGAEEGRRRRECADLSFLKKSSLPLTLCVTSSQVSSPIHVRRMGPWELGSPPKLQSSTGTSRRGNAQHAARSLLVRERGDVETLRAELIELNRDRLDRLVRSDRVETVQSPLSPRFEEISVGRSQRLEMIPSARESSFLVAF